MATLKKNFIYNTILTLSGYLFPFLTFPYVTRVLGVDNFGVVNLVQSVVDYFILFSTLGIATVGLREIAQTSNDKDKMSNVFSMLTTIHLLISLVALIIYLFSVFFIPQLAIYKDLYLVGASKIIANVFLIEWLFKGIQDFKYITYRTILIRFLYVVAIFIFVRERNDCWEFIVITMLQVVVNAIVNWIYAKKYVNYKPTTNGVKRLMYPLFTWGANTIMLSFYTTFNVMILGFVCGTVAVGNYTAATKIYAIIFSILQAYNGVFIPYLNKLYSEGNITEFKNTISKSFKIVTTFTIPMVVTFFILAPEIIKLIAGEEFYGAVTPARIVMLQLLVIGISQITNSQILLSLKKDKEILIATIFGTLSMIICMITLTPTLAESGAALSVLVSHIVEFSFLLFYAKKSLEFEIPYKDIVVSFIAATPIIGICLFVKETICNYLLVLLVALSIVLIYFLFVQVKVLNNNIITSVLKFRKQQPR